MVVAFCDSTVQLKLRQCLFFYWINATVYIWIGWLFASLMTINNGVLLSQWNRKSPFCSGDCDHFFKNWNRKKTPVLENGLAPFYDTFLYIYCVTKQFQRKDNHAVVLFVWTYINSMDIFIEKKAKNTSCHIYVTGTWISA